MSEKERITETRRYDVLEHLVPAIYMGDEPDDERDRATLRQVLEDLDTLDGGGWTFTADVVDVDEFARPEVGERGRVATVTLTRRVTLPAHVWVGYYDSEGTYHCPDTEGRICADREAFDAYVTACQRAALREVRADHAGDLHEALRDMLDADEDEREDAAAEARDVLAVYEHEMTSFAWEFGTAAP